jgi:hypothetical protein
MYINLEYQILEHLLYMVKMFASSVVDRGFAPRSGPIKD